MNIDASRNYRCSTRIRAKPHKKAKPHKNMSPEFAILIYRKLTLNLLYVLFHQIKQSHFAVVENAQFEFYPHDKKQQLLHW